MTSLNSLANGARCNCRLRSVGGDTSIALLLGNPLAGAGIRFNTDVIVDWIPQSLFATEVSLGRLYAGMAKQKLDLL